MAVAVVDNSQGADGLDSVAGARPHTRYLRGPGRGFGAAANIAARTSSADVLVLLNPDCRPRTEQIDEVVATLQADPTLALVAANTVLEDGTPTSASVAGSRRYRGPSSTPSEPTALPPGRHMGPREA